ncbi:MAG: PASTA domain-containing protein [bacterium]|nr:PASTA domain-containing protein [bacterium]
MLDYQYDDNLEKGTIIKQKMKSGTLLKGGDIQEVTVSAGLEPKEVPELIGISEQDAVSLLEEQQLTVNINVVINKEKEEGIVLSQSIDAGEIVDKFTEVSIDVCSHGIDVPDFVGLTYEAALSRASESGLQISASYVYGGDGTINSQSPSENSVVDEGSVIDVKVGMTQSEFTAQLVASINARRRAAGLREVSLSSVWTQSASALAASGLTSAEATKNGIDWSYLLPANRGSSFWASRDGISTVDNMISRIPFNSEAFLDSRMTVIGVGYSGNRISILIAIR